MELFIGKTDKINKFLNWTYVKSAHEWEGKKTFDAGGQHQGTDDTEKNRTTVLYTNKLHPYVELQFAVVISPKFCSEQLSIMNSLKLLN